MKYHVSLIDTDLYKLTQMQAVIKLFPVALVEYTFINRDNREFPEGFATRLREIINSFVDIKLTKDEHAFLRERCRYLTPFYLDYLKNYKYDPYKVIITQEGTNLKISILGKWRNLILWEVPLMATISELYFEMTNQKISVDRNMVNADKLKGLKEIGVPFSDFGTRRRYSFENHDKFIQDAKIYGGNNFVGTSNVYLAMKYDLNPIGTMAHEWIQFHAAKYGFQNANQMAMENWVKVYNGELGIALTDTFTSDVFFKTFDLMYSKLYDGVRQDSGNPVTFAEKAIAHYKNLQINPLHKRIVFSDSINNLELVQKIHNVCNGRINDLYGVGTYFTNDVGVKPLNMVIKLTGTNINYYDEWIPTVKLSDNVTKNTGDEKMVRLCKETLNIKGQ